MNSKKRRVDIAIIGAGPAGGAAANYLAGCGLKVILLEQEQLPRPKACGGLVPAGALKEISPCVADLVDHHVERRQYLYNHQAGHLSYTPQSVLALVDRQKFDAGLVEKALAAGNGDVLLEQGFRVAGIVENSSTVEILASNGTKVEAQYVIAADGAASKTARCLGLNSGRLNAVGIDTEMRVPDSCYQHYSSRVLFDYYCLPAGYAWVFPKAEGVLSVGVASWRKGVPCKAAMDKYLQYQFKKSQVLGTQRRSHPIPVFMGKTNIASQRVCLVGDAASLVDPVSGEGIRFAIQSGLAAAETVHDLMRGDGLPDHGPSGCLLYEKRILEQIGGYLEGLCRFAYLPFREAPEYYYNRFVLGSQPGSYQ